MKKFNQTITIEVSVNSIAQNLLGKMDKSTVNADSIVETLMEIVPLEKMQYLHNVLNGFTNEIDVKVGEMFYCNHKLYHPNHPIVKENDLKDKYIEIGNCVVTNINLYTKDKVEVEYEFWSRDGIQKERFWVNHQLLEVWREENTSLFLDEKGQAM